MFKPKAFDGSADSSITAGTNARVEPCLAASIEISPGQIEKKSHLLKHIPPTTRTYIVDLGNRTPAEWGALCRQLVNEGLEPVPHIAARRLTSRDELNERLAAMSGEAGTRDALLIAGEAPAQVGPFASTLDVLETSLLDQHGIRRLGVAGHPEGSAAIPSAQAEAALAAKQALAERTGADMRIVTQFGFDVGAALRWSETLEEAGIDLPVHLGIAGPASVTSLLKYAAMCGVEASSRFLAKNTATVTSLVTTHSPEQYVRPIEQHVAAYASCLITQTHVFPFGGIEKAARWLSDRGSWSSDARAVFEQHGLPRNLGSTGIAPQKFG